MHSKNIYRSELEHLVQIFNLYYDKIPLIYNIYKAPAFL
ncbi:MAG: hypothetical protein JETT_0751 [Candidatus Jettenia ecosi]|uniref:Uncharacterized protein n=1 Tax=Candidatus Jettenia ecosi TaxID=2494326 RepID=A0A533QDX8_9BACT|nr:MAG: hypothetical protein JETT_0751 [Candidatus Jettenia ecosi]